MKQSEKDEKLKVLNERQLKLLSIMRESDDHAAKCMKLGLTFAKEYPEEYKAYEDARDEYNENEAKAAEIEATDVEDEEVHYELEQSVQ